jgi:hypothetical protein
MTAVQTRRAEPEVRESRWNVNVLGAASGAVYVVLLVVGNAMHSEGAISPLGYSLEMLAYVALACFLAFVATALRAPGSWAAAVAVVGGITALAIKLSGWTAVLASTHAEVTAETAAALVQIDESAFVIGWLPHGVFVVGLAVAAMLAGRLPRWLGWTGAVLGAAEIAAAGVRMQEPVAIPFLLALLWIIVVSVLLARGSLGRKTAWSVDV